MRRREIKYGRRIVVLCEGETEEIAVKHFLRRQWEADGLKAVGLQAINLQGHLEDVYVKVPLFRKNPKVVAVFTLIDLYEMGRAKYGNYDSLDDKIAQAKMWLRDKFGSAHEGFFFPHLSVHEVEAWLLAEGDCLAKRLKDSTIEPNRNAETKNLDNPPSRRIDALFKNRRHGDGYHKINDGTPLFKCLEFRPVYNTCRYFREFYDELKSVGQSALKQN